MFGGDLDQELEEQVRYRFVDKAEMSQPFLEKILEWSKDGSTVMMSAQFKDE